MSLKSLLPLLPMPLKKMLLRGREKIRIGFTKRSNSGHLYIAISGWPFRSQLDNKPNFAKLANRRRSDNSPSIKLNVGGGKGHPKLDDWTIVDLRESSADLLLDITKEKLPYEDNSVDIIFTSHTLEHIYPQKIDFVLDEFYRVLKPDVGLLRIAVPDINVAIQAYLDEDYGFFRASHVGQFDSQAPIGGLLASWFYSTRIFMDPELRNGDGHVHCFDYEYLRYWLKKSGFRHIWPSKYQQSVLPELRSDAFDRHPNDSLFVEAIK